MSKGYCVWRPQIGEAFEKAIRKSVGESLLAEKIIEAGIIFRALWLILDHIVDLEEDRNNNVVTGIRLLLDYAGQISPIIELIRELHGRFNETTKSLNNLSYANNLQQEYFKLMGTLQNTI